MRMIRRKAALILLGAGILINGCSASSASGLKTEEAVYLGVVGYGDEDRNIDNKNTFSYRFAVGGREEIYTIDNGEREEDGVYAYKIQNILWEGCLYDLVVEDDVVTRAIPLNDDSEWVVSGEVFDKNAEGAYIQIGDKRVSVTNETGFYQVNPAPGGSSVEEAKPQIGDSVRAVLNSNGKAANVYVMPVSKPYSAPVSGVPGERTVLNYLRTALTPVGTTLYVYGGGWNWQNTRAGVQATSIGLQQSWIDFFQMQDSDYVFRKRSAEDPDDPQHSYYPYQHYNEYYYAGLDCSGYMGWILYNVMNTEDGGAGYVMSSTETALNYSLNGWGTYTRELTRPANQATSTFLPGDVVSISGHVWICLGTCSDGSILFLHSSPTDSRTGGHGGGVQLSAIGENKDCEAFRLADHYMSLAYPDWYSRYEVVLRDYNKYADMMSDANAGKFSWDVSGSGILTDPEGVRAMLPSQILELLFGGI